MRRKMVRISFALFFFTAVLLTASCSRKVQWQSADGSLGEQVRWTPSVPQIGDLVRVEVFIPDPADESAELFLSDSAGVPVPPLTDDEAAGGNAMHWSFRITRSGTWFWVNPDKRQTLWIAPTIAADATELKKVDAQILWSGKVLP